MKRDSFTLAAIAVLLIGEVVATYAQEGPSTRQGDTYAIYSTLLSNSREVAENLTLAIAGATRPAIGRPTRASEPCIVPSPEYSSRWTEVLADFSARVETSVALVRDLNVSMPYILISNDEVASFQAARRGAGLPLRNPQATAVTPTPQLDPKFQTVRHIFFLSDVYFSKDRTLALTGLANWCGGLCGSGEWKIFEKVNGRWVPVRPVRDCRVDA